MQRIQHSGGGFYVGVGFCGSGVAWCAVVFGSFSVARWRGRGSVRRSGGGGALGRSLSLARVPVPHAGGGVPCGGGGVCAFRGVPRGSALPGSVVGVAGSRLAFGSSGSPSVPGHAVIRSGARVGAVPSLRSGACSPGVGPGVLAGFGAGGVPWLPCVVWRGSSSARRWSGSRAPGFPGARFASRPGGRVRRSLRAFRSPWGAPRGWMRSFVGRSPGPPCSRSPPVGGAPAVGRSPGALRRSCALSSPGACWWFSPSVPALRRFLRPPPRGRAGVVVAPAPGRRRRSLWGSGSGLRSGLRRCRGSSLRFRSVVGGGGSGRGPFFCLCAGGVSLAVRGVDRARTKPKPKTRAKGRGPRKILAPSKMVSGGGPVARQGQALRVPLRVPLTRSVGGRSRRSRGRGASGYRGKPLRRKGSARMVMNGQA